jgi:hypothetical protein
MTRTQSVVRLGSVSLVLGFGLLLVEARAAYVSPMIGGGQAGMTVAPMKHADIFFDGTNVTVDVDQLVPTPLLRPLTPPDQFDPAQPWSVLQDKAYNYQFAWNPGGVFAPPAGTGVWVERLFQDSELQVFARPPKFWTDPWPNPWPTVFANDGDRWKWGGTMTHNAYAVLNPTQSIYTARYRVYIGDAVTGTPIAGYGSAEATFTWLATPIPEPTTLILLGCSVAGLALRRRPAA